MLHLAASSFVPAARAAGLLSLAALFSCGSPPLARIDTRDIAMPDGRIVAFARTEVTRAHWKACHDAKGCGHAPASLDDAASGQLPMAGINYFDAMDYISWINAKSGHRYRLPTRAEWLVAASELPRPARKKLFDDPRLAWAADYGAMPRISPRLKPAGSFGTFRNGISDLAGNVWEWTATCAAEGFDAATCPAFIVEGLHEAKLSVFIRNPATGGCASGTPPAHVGLRLVEDIPNRLSSTLRFTLASSP
jgi:formylglycine-generating enzyme required for sulfatase activity